MSRRGRFAVAGSRHGARGRRLVLRSRSEAPAPAATTATPDFAKDVAPIVRETCAGCHRDGGIAPFAFRTERDLASRAALVVAAVEGRRMPPWPPSTASPRYVGQAASNARRRRARDARPLGEGTARAAGRRPPQHSRGTARGATIALRAGESRLELAMATPYRPSAARGATDDYRCFLLDPKLADDRFVTSARIEPGAASLVHHVILYRIGPGSVAEAASLDRRTPGAGWTCFGGPGVAAGTANPRGFLDDAGWIAAWAPGSGGDRFAPEPGSSFPRAVGS